MKSSLFSFISRPQVAFSRRFSAPSAFPSMLFDSAFIDHEKQRWEFLRKHMKLSVETIAAHQDLLLASLPDRLAPRWQLLSRIASEQADFKAEDHLAALASCRIKTLLKPSWQTVSYVEFGPEKGCCLLHFLFSCKMVSA